MSEGCRHCYAETMAGRFCGVGQPYHGLATRRGGHGKWTGEVRLIPEHLADPLRWQTPRRIFANSMSDMFHENLDNETIAAMFAVMAAAKRHTFQVLTKRSDRMLEWFNWFRSEVVSEQSKEDRNLHAERRVLAGYAQFDLSDGSSADEDRQFWRIMDATEDIEWPLRNVWLGVSVEDQDAAEKRIPTLLATPAAVRFLSCEPLLGEVDLDKPRCEGAHCGPEDGWCVADDGATPWCAEHDQERSYGHWLHADGGIDWVIAGCESGRGARACEVEWLRLLRDQCTEHAVPFFLKQAVLADRLVKIGRGSREKRGGVVELPYLDGKQHKAFPA